MRDKPSSLLTSRPEITVTAERKEAVMGELSLCERVSKFILKWLFPISLIVAIIIGSVWPYPGDQLSSYYVGDYRIVPTINVATIFFISGLKLETAIVKNVIMGGSGIAFAYGLTSILIITASMGFVTYRIPFHEPEFSFGLAVFSIVPTTLGTGISMVTEANGNTGLAILLTVATNLLGIITVPYILHLIMLTDKNSAIQAASLDQVQLLLGLVYQVLIPLTVGKFVQETISSVKPWVQRHKTLMKVIVCESVALVVWQSVSRDDMWSIAWYSIFQLIAAGIILHVVFLVFNYFMASSVFKFQRPDKKTIVIMCSQKTLPITLAVLSSSGGVGSEGLMTIPPILAHLSQILIDSYIQSVWGSELEIGQQQLDDVSITHRDSAPDANGEEPS